MSNTQFRTDTEHSAVKPVTGEEPSGSLADVVHPMNTIGAYNGRAPDGKFARGNTAAVVSGRHSRQYWQSVESVLRERRTVLLRDLGVDPDDCPRVLDACVAGLLQAEALRDNCFARVVADAGPVPPVAERVEPSGRGSHRAAQSSRWHGCSDWTAAASKLPTRWTLSAPPSRLRTTGPAVIRVNSSCGRRDCPHLWLQRRTRVLYQPRDPFLAGGMGVTAVQFMNVFDEFRSPSWAGWRAVVARLTPDVRELYVAAGRGSGKTIVALLASWAVTRSYRRAPGEEITIGVFAPDRAPARTTYR